MTYVVGELIRVKGRIGSTIHTAIAECIEMANKYDCNIILSFNGKELFIRKTDTVKLQADEYFN